MSVDLSTLTLEVNAESGIRNLDRYDASAGRANKSTTLLDGAIVKLGGALALRELVRMADTYTMLEARLRLVTASTAQYNAVQSQLFNIAQQSRQSLEDVVTLYARIGRGAKELGASQAQLIQFTSGVNAALVVSGTSSAQASGALLQLSQALNSGIVRAEEFNSILEGAPRIAQAVAEGFGATGLSVGQLRTRIINGQVSSQEFFQAFLKGSAQIKAEAATIPTTVGGAFTQLQNALLQYIGQANSANGASGTLASGITALANNIGGLISVAKTLAVVFAARYFSDAADRVGAYSLSLAKGRAETLAYAEASVRVVQAKAAEARAETLATIARETGLKVTLEEVAAQRALEVQLTASNRAEQARASRTLATPGISALGGAVVAREQAALASATNALAASTARYNALGTQQVETQAALLATSRALTVAREAEAVASGAATVAMVASARATGLLATAMAGAATVARAFWLAIGGLPGAVLLGLYAVYEAVQYLSKGTDDGAKRFTEAGTKATAYTKTLDGMSASVLQAAKAQEQLNLAQLAGQLNAAGTKLIGARGAAASVGVEAKGRALDALEAAKTAQQEYNALLGDAAAIEARLAVLTERTTDATKAAVAATKSVVADANERVISAQAAAQAAGLEGDAAARMGVQTKAVLALIKAGAELKGNDLKITQQAIIAERNYGLAAIESARALKFKHDNADAKDALARQIALNTAFQYGIGTLDEVNAKYDLLAALRKIDVEYSGKQADALKILAIAQSAATVEDAKFRASREADKVVADTRIANLKAETDALKQVKDALEALRDKRDNGATAAARDIELVNRQIALHGKSASEVKKLTAEYTLHDKQLEYVAAGLDTLSALQAAQQYVKRASELERLTNGTFKWGTALESVNGALQLLTQSLGGAAGAAVRNIAAVSSALQLLIKAQEAAKKNTGKDSTTSQQIGGGIGAAFAGFQAGSAFGSTTTSRTVGTIGGALSGAAAGATIGASLGPAGILIGAGIGALAGAAGGFLASSKKAREEAERLVEVQKQLAAQFASIRASLSNDALGGAILQARAQFDALRKSIESGLGGRKNEAARNSALAEANALEAQRIAQLQQEYAETQKKLQLDQTIRGLVANGRVAEAEALTFAAQQTEKYAALVKQGADATTLALEAETQLAEARKRAADLAEAERRRTFDLNNNTRAFSDPRGASQAAFDEAAAQRYADAVNRGASAAEKAAIEAYNLAAALDRAIQVQEADTRTRESLIGRGLGAQGNTRGQQDAAFAAAQRQEMVDAIRSGMSPSNQALLKFVQFAERSQRQMQQAIEDGTKIIREAAEKQIAAIDLQISAEKARSAAEQARLDGEIQRVKDTAAATVAALDLQIAGIESVRDAQVKALDVQKELLSAQLATQRDQLKTAEDALSVAQNAYQALSAFSQSLNLSDQSTATPVQRLADASGQFEALRALAAGGDAGAAGQLPEAARAFLEASKNVNASGVGFQQDFARVQGVVATLAEKFGKETSAASAQVAALRSMVTATESQLALLEKTRTAIVETAALEISVLRDLRDATTRDAATQIEKLDKMKEADKTASGLLLERLGLDRLAVEAEASRQIAMLVKLETEAHLARLAQDAYWTTYLAMLQDTGSGTGTTGTPDIMRVELVNVAPDPVADSSNARLVETVTELRATVRVLQAGFTEQKTQIDLLLSATSYNTQVTKRGLEALVGVIASAGAV